MRLYSLSEFPNIRKFGIKEILTSVCNQTNLHSQETWAPLIRIIYLKHWREEKMMAQTKNQKQV
jgi:hypothetical protein